MTTPAEIFVDLIGLLLEEQALHEQERLPIDRTRAVDRAMSLLKDLDPEGEHRLYIIGELRCSLNDAPLESTTYLERSLLQRLEAEEWGRQK